MSHGCQCMQGATARYGSASAAPGVKRQAVKLSKGDEMLALARRGQQLQKERGEARQGAFRYTQLACGCDDYTVPRGEQCRMQVPWCAASTNTCHMIAHASMCGQRVGNADRPSTLPCCC